MTVSVSVGVGVGEMSRRHSNYTPPNPEVERFVSVHNMLIRATETRGTYTRKFDRFVHKIAAECSQIQFCWNAWYLPLNDTGLCADIPSFTIVRAKAEANGVVVQLTFSGATNKVVPAGANDVRCDPLTPSMFGLTSFFGVNVITTAEVVATAGGLVTSGFSGAFIGDFSGAQSIFANDEATVTNWNSAAALVFSGGATEQRSGGIQPFCVGNTSKDTVVWLARGDSITQGTGDGTSGGLFGRAWFHRVNALRTVPLPTANFAIHGSRGDAGANDSRVSYWYPLTNRAVIFYGTNDFGTAGTAATVEVVNARILNLRSQMISAGILSSNIGVCKLLCSTTGTFTTEEGQTVRSGWVAGSRPDTFNNGLSSLGFAFVIPFDSIRGTTDPYKFKPNTSTDGTHPSATGNGLMATEAAPFM